MSAIGTIGIWAVLVGAIVGAYLHNRAPRSARTRVERLCLRFGVFASLFMAVPIAITSDRPSSFVAVVALGLIAAVPLVAGVVMRALGWASGGSKTSKGEAGV